MHGRSFLPFLAAAVWAACSTPAPGPAKEAEAPEVPAQQPARGAPADSGMVQLHTLSGSGLKFNGTYAHQNGGIHYFMRFYERGNVVLIAGQQKADAPVDLRSFLKQDAQSGENNIHNAPVTRRNDSLFFTTMVPRGAITYAGVVQGDSVRFLKRSKINGKEAVVAYGFTADPEVLNH